MTVQTYYLTKYALSQGITVHEGRPLKSNSIMIDIPNKYGYYRLGRDVFLSRDDAVQAARAMKKKRIESLRRSLLALETVDFT